MNSLETRDLARLVVQFEGRTEHDSLLFALYVLHRIHLTEILTTQAADDDRHWAELLRLHVA